MRAALLARIYEVFPLICPSCQTPLTFIAFLTDPEPIPRILAHIGEPTSPPLLHPARGPPQTELDMGPEEAQRDEAVQEWFPDDLHRSTDFDPDDPEPVPRKQLRSELRRVTPHRHRLRRRLLSPTSPGASGSLRGAEGRASGTIV